MAARTPRRALTKKPPPTWEETQRRILWAWASIFVLDVEAGYDRDDAWYEKVTALIVDVEDFCEEGEEERPDFLDDLYAALDERRVKSSLTPTKRPSLRLVAGGDDA